MGSEEFAELRSLLGDRFVIKNSGSLSVGTNLFQVNKDFRSLVDEVRRGEALLIARGEINNLTLNLLDVEHYRIALAEERVTRQFTGLFWDENESAVPCPFIVRIPQGIVLAVEFDGQRVVRENLQQFYSARKYYEKQCQQENKQPDYIAIRTQMSKREGVTFVEHVYPDALLVKPAQLADTSTLKGRGVLNKIQDKNQEIIRDLVKRQTQGGVYYSDIYELTEKVQHRDIKVTSADTVSLSVVVAKQKVLMNAIVANLENAGLTIETGMASEEKVGKYSALKKRELISPQARVEHYPCLLYTSPSPRDGLLSRMPSSA